MATPAQNRQRGIDIRHPNYQEIKSRIHQELLNRLNLERLTQMDRVDAEPELRTLIVSMLERDFERLQDCYKRMDRSPLGAAAFAGTSFPIDRAMTARKLHFHGIVENSIDAVSDRD